MKFVDLLEGSLPHQKFDPLGPTRLIMSGIPYFILPAVILLGTFIIFDHAWLLMVIVYAILPLID